LHAFPNIFPAALLTAAGLAACSGEHAAGTAPESLLPAAASPADGCIPAGRLEGAVYGGIEGSIDWRGGELVCEGMPRPEGAGARLRFSGTLDGDRPLEVAVIIAMPELERGETPRETPATVTVIEENEGRFFSNAAADVCWSDVTRQQPVAETSYAIDGIVYCVAPLAEVNGSSGVSFTELVYSGRIDWSET